MSVGQDASGGSAEPDTTPRPVLVDVARRARVSTATVSNVLNKPQLVAFKTRLRVIKAMDELKYHRNEAAASLRLGKTSQPATATPVPGRVPEDPAGPVTDEPRREPGTTHRAPWHEIPRGMPVHVLVHGQVVGTGTIDDAMPDGSAVWIWLEDGAGRTMIEQKPGVLIAYA
ncbi:LacI family DNA-binding transcriptional regulator [Paenarthrobacter sp. YAF11_1]|uniref:LacI family DNA-binding transcriptional regulator n=1 Tax=Paenarthrobacter sp. YAF11_1 TaxID=3233074 RepID=UPI003F9B14D4